MNKVIRIWLVDSNLNFWTVLVKSDVSSTNTKIVKLGFFMHSMSLMSIVGSVGLSSHGFWPLGMRFWVWKISVESAQKCRWWWTHTILSLTHPRSVAAKFPGADENWSYSFTSYPLLSQGLTLKNQCVLMKLFRKCFVQILWSGICQVDSISTLLESILIILVRIFWET